MRIKMLLVAGTIALAGCGVSATSTVGTTSTPPDTYLVQHCPHEGQPCTTELIPYVSTP